ncbi:Uncharacterized protein M6B38_242465 [Iris pallida]|uniref:Thioredoxin-like fold domain-containing protein n=1 Tax=Iris pallida TaxID=29817 RepID=A0AAX6DJT3_IRIPA|nr:Uncharacterized protein M6B38_242465 [Iris pallida]
MAVVSSPPSSSSFLLIFFFLVWITLAQTPIPAKYDGFLYGGNNNYVWGDSVVLEAFLDPMCPDSRDTWPPLQQAFEYYSPRLAILVHPFPLPYHSNSYTFCRALQIANKLNSSTTFPLFELFFKYQEKFYNAPTYNTSRASIIEDLSNLAVAVIGKDSLPAFLSGFNDSQTDIATIISFKYGCSRGVPGTPFFFLNGIPLPGYGSALDFQTWRSIIDPLFVKK